MIDAWQFNDEVLFTRQDMPSVTMRDVVLLKDLAQRNPRERMRLCTHADPNADLHEMLIVHSKNVYVRPHRHVRKMESYHFIEGTGVAVSFDPDGTVSSAVTLSADSPSHPFYYRIPVGLYHCLVFVSDWAVFHETTLGPFRKEDTEYAPWAPADQESQAARDNLVSLRQQVLAEVC